MSTDRIREIIRDHVVADDIPVDTDHLTDDLGADSLDIVELAMALEAEFDITINDEKFGDCKTVADATVYVMDLVGKT